MKALLTGATGSLGAATAAGLLAGGIELTVFQRGASQLPCREIRGDVADPDAVATAAAGQDVVVHLAAKVDVVGPWAEYEHANIDGTRSVIAACRVAGVRRLVHVSTPSVAHRGQALIGVGAGPADPEQAQGHYARSKALAEQLARQADGPELGVLVIRPHLVWGPGDPQLVERIVERARRHRLAFIGSGAALIDTTYVSNAVDALLAAVRVSGSAHGEALVVSNGEPRPVGEILARLCAAAAVPVPRHHVPYAVAHVAGRAFEKAWSVAGRRDPPPITTFLAEQLGTAHWFDQRHTRAVLEWAPRVSLDEGFALLAAAMRGRERTA